MSLHEGLKQDLTHSLRIMGKSPGFTGVALLILILGIGATTAIFSVVNAVLLRALPFPAPERLVHIVASDRGDPQAGVPYEAFTLWRSQNRTFQDLAIFYRNSGWSRVIVGGAIEPQSGQAGFVSANLFSVLGVSPMLGRVFDEGEETERAPVAILSHSLWERHFASSPAVLGRTIEVDGRAFTIIGVMPREFQFPAPETLLWLPITTNRYWFDRPQRDDLHARGFYMRWNVVGRLRAAASPEMALADVTTVAGRLAVENPDWNMGLGVKVEPFRVEIAGNAKVALLALFASAAFVLLIACSNVGSLMLARGAARTRELAIRSALGATQGRIIRQMLCESLVLAFFAASGAIALSSAATRLLVRFGPPDLPRLAETRIDGTVLCFALAAAVFSAVLFAMAPVLRAGRTDPIEALKTGGRALTAGPGRIRIGSLLVVAEFALAVVLLTGAGLLLRTLRGLETVDLGFRPESVLTMRLRLPNGVPTTRQMAFQERLEARLSSIPGLRAVGGISGLFELDGPPLNSLRAVEGRAPGQETARPLTWTTVSGDYFRAMDIPLVSGRHFSDRDTANSPRVAIIDMGMAQRYWPGENPLGKRFKGQDPRGRNDEWLTVVGVVRSARRQGLEREPTPHVYEWSGQAGPTTDWVIRTAGDPATFAGVVRTAVREVEPGAVISQLMSLTAQLDLQTSARRFRTWLLGLFAVLALLLSTTGIYGVVSYKTAQRTQEVGIRMALGAGASSILGMILRQGLTIAMAGLAVGMVGAVALTRLISGLLFGVTPTDPLTFSAVAAVLLAVAAGATSIPAVRATRVDPITALRAE